MTVTSAQVTGRHSNILNVFYICWNPVPDVLMAKTKKEKLHYKNMSSVSFLIKFAWNNKDFRYLLSPRDIVKEHQKDHFSNFWLWIEINLLKFPRTTWLHFVVVVLYSEWQHVAKHHIWRQYSVNWIMVFDWLLGSRRVLLLQLHAQPDPLLGDV